MSCHLPLYIKCEVLVNWMFSEAVGLPIRSEEHTSELQSRPHLVCRLLLEKKKKEVIGFEVMKKKLKTKNEQANTKLRLSIIIRKNETVVQRLSQAAHRNVVWIDLHGIETT